MAKGTIIKICFILLVSLTRALGSVVLDPGGTITIDLNTGNGTDAVTVGAPPLPPPSGSTNVVLTPTLPTNDDFANAIQFGSSSNLVSVCNSGATLEPGEPAYDWPAERRTVWFAWTPPISGRCSVSDSVPSQYDAPVLTNTTPAISWDEVFYPGGGISLNPISGSYGDLPTGYFGYTMQCGNDSLNGHIWWASGPTFRVYRGDGLAKLTLIGQGLNVLFEAIAGIKYLISMEGNDVSPEMTSSMCLFEFPAPANDSFSNALRIVDVASVDLKGNVASATKDAGEPAINGLARDGGSVWFGWKAPTFGSVILDAGDNRDLPMAVFTGDSVSNLSVVAFGTGSVGFFGIEGVDYSIALYSKPTIGNFSVHLSGPQFRSFETNAAGLFPNGFYPALHGTRGLTALLYARRDGEWKCVEIEPIVNFQSAFLRRPQTGEENFRITTIDSEMPAPRVDLSSGFPVLRGFVGQRCEVSRSANLSEWQSLGNFLLETPTRSLRSNPVGSATQFFRVTQSLPQAVSARGQ